MRKKILALALALIPMLGFSQHRSESEAITVAQEFWGKGVNRTKLKAVSQKSMAKAKARAMAKAASTTGGSKQSFYVINDEERNRFVIVSADERLYKILGYSDNGMFGGDSIPLGLADILVGYDQQYEYMLKNMSKTVNANTTAGSGTRIEPLIKTKWGQTSPYNNDCPAYYGVLTSVTGCVATAMAQVMNYHKYPTTGKGYTSYTSTSLGFNEQMSFSSCSFDWNNMMDVYDDHSTDEQKDAVAKLMHACGVAVHMDYTFKESGATAPDMAYALHKYFGYNTNLKYYERKYFSKDEWNAIIQKDLSDGLPILYCGMGESINDDGTTSRYGHQFVLDGYDGESKYHFNWGWKGEYDGYFELTALNPSEDNDYSIDQAMVCNVSTETAGRYEDVFFATAFLVDTTSVQIGGKIASSFNPICYSAHTNSYDAYFKGTFGIGVFDVDHNYVKSLYSNTGYGMFKAGTTFKDPLSASLYFDSSTFKEGDKYYIAPYAKSYDATDYTWMRTTYGLWDYYLAEVKDGKVTLTLKGVATKDYPELQTGVLYATAYNSNNVKVRWNISLTKDSEEENKYWLGNIDPSLDGAANHVYGLVDETGTILTIPQGQSVGTNLIITNYSDNNDIQCLISSSDSTITIPVAWGCMKIGSGDPIQQSCYTSTEINYTPKDSDDIITVEKPTIIVKDEVLQILCGTADVKIYYTLDGTTPSEHSTLYKSPVELNSNCTVKSIAILDDNHSSEIAEYAVNSFTVAKPVVSVADNKVTIQCATADAMVYYTLDGSDPKRRTNLYNEPFAIDHSGILKAYAIKDKYNDSEVIEQSVIYIPSDPTNTTIAINENVAGKLSERVTTSDIIGKSLLSITGELNGTDFLYLYRLLNAGNITDLDLAGARIVSGGDPYYTPSVIDPYYTQNDVIGTNMFYKLNSLVSLILPINAKKIEMFAIYDCNNIGKLVLPTECIELEMDAIYNCKNINTLSIGRNLQVFDGSAINNCPRITEFIVDSANETYKAKDGILLSKDETILVKYPCGLTNSSYCIPFGVKTIEESAFEDAQFSEIVFPDGLTSIGASAFQNCKKLLNIEMPNSIYQIGNFVFWGCLSLNNVTLSDNVVRIPSYSFRECSSLREFTIGKSVSEISDDAFPGCVLLQKFNVDAENKWYCSQDGVLYSKDMSNLIVCPTAYYSANFFVPDGVSKISDNAFYHCLNIEKITLPESLSEIGNTAFAGCKNLESIIMPTHLDAIGYMAFSGCAKLGSLVIPEGVSVIQMSLADGCSKLSFLSLPKSIKEIENYAFSGCKSLKNIRCNIDDANKLYVEPSILDGSYNSFSKVPDDCTWHVLEGYASSYTSQPWWISTWNIIDDLKDSVNGIASVTNAMDIKVVPGEHSVDIVTSTNKIVNIYNLHGHLVNSVKAKAGHTTTIPLQSGVYVINKNKIRIK